MSLEVLIFSPRICSGDAYSGVIKCAPVAVGSIVAPNEFGESSFAIPKSRSFGSPFGPIKMFVGFMSRCTTRF